MERKNRIYIIMTGVVALTLIWLSRPAPEVDESLKSLDGSRERQEGVSTESQPRHRDVEGVLWSSDDEAKGNLMLVKNNATIYIRTSRDFSDLIGEHVIASIDGTLDNFTLLNIEENLTKDGFINTN
ncbi:MAG: hypothetical protein HY506_01550 [Candidatus Yanofskybacteria bacterium]|nr:hypothetical protein [Candidatus Yanofskybacteria bacterium]